MTHEDQQRVHGWHAREAEIGFDFRQSKAWQEGWMLKNQALHVEALAREKAHQALSSPRGFLKPLPPTSRG